MVSYNRGAGLLGFVVTGYWKLQQHGESVLELPVGYAVWHRPLGYRGYNV